MLLRDIYRERDREREEREKVELRVVEFVNGSEDSFI